MLAGRFRAKRFGVRCVRALLFSRIAAQSSIDLRADRGPCAKRHEDVPHSKAGCARETGAAASTVETRWLVATALLVLPFLGAQGQLPSPRLDTAFPQGVQAGTSAEVTLAGAELGDVSALVFSGAGLSATKIEGLKFRVAAAADATRGFQELRVTNSFGISTPLPFIVSDAVEVVDAGKNQTRETALALSIPGVVHGRADAEQRDFYKLTAKTGQALQLACSACALDSVMDPVVTVIDATGRTIARGDDQLDRDAELSFVAPADGEYFVVVHDKVFAGSAAHQYRLAVAADPAATVAVPLRLPAGAADFNVGAPQRVAEIEPNDTPATAQAPTLPAEVQATFDVDWFAFQGEAGKPLWLEVFAERDGHASDAALVVHKVTRDAQGAETSKMVLELDDHVGVPGPPQWLLGSRDPAASFVPDAAGIYRVQVVDRFRSRRPYRLIVREAVPDFAVVALADSPANEDKKLFKWQPNVRRGGSAAFPIAALRRGYDGEIILRVEGLPEGLTAGGVIAAGALTGVLVFQATADAKPWCSAVRVVAEGGGAAREVQAVSYRWNVDNRDNVRLAGRLSNVALGVADEVAPLSIAATESKVWEAAIGADLEIPLKLTRPNADAQAKGEWQLAPVGLPGLAKFDAVKVDGAAANDAKLVLKLQNKDGNTFKAGTYTVWIRGRGTVAYKADAKDKVRDLKHVEFSTPLTLTLKDPPAVAAAK